VNTTLSSPAVLRATARSLGKTFRAGAAKGASTEGDAAGWLSEERVGTWYYQVMRIANVSSSGKDKDKGKNQGRGFCMF